MQRGQLATLDNVHFFSFVLDAHPFNGEREIAVPQDFR
jgi:hypothetical protein